MATNSLGSLGSFEVAPEEEGVHYGMEHATGYEGTFPPGHPQANYPPDDPRAKKPPHVGPPLDEQHAQAMAVPGPPPPRVWSSEEILELAGDVEANLSRLEKHSLKSPYPELTEQVKTQLLALASEYVAVQRVAARAILVTGWDQMVGYRESRKLYLRIATCRPADFLSEARGVFETLKTKWISALTRSASTES